MKLTNDDVQDILQLLDASPIDELHLQTERFKLTLRRSVEGGWTQEQQVLTEPALNEGKAPPVSKGITGDEAASSSGPAAKHLLEIATPLPGIFYRAPKPGAPPFVEIGDRVGEKTVVAIIETMKLMSSIYAGVSGTVVEICLKNAEFAEQDAVLIRIEPEAS